MTPSDIAALYNLINQGGVVVVLLAIVGVLVVAVRWLIAQVLSGKDQAIAYRDALIADLASRIERQQDLFDRAMDLLKEPGRRR